MRNALVLLTVFALLCSCCLFAFAQGPFTQSSYYQQGDYSLHYRVLPASGSAKGRVLFIHGFFCSTLSWEQLAGFYNQAGYDCVLVDLPGFGYSTREAEAVAPQHREDLLAGLLEQLAPGQRWIIGGHSMGGGVALNLAAAYPEKVQALLLFAPAGNMALTADSFAMRLLTPFTQSLAGLLDTAFRLLLPALRVPLLSKAVLAMFGLPCSYDINRFLVPLEAVGTGGSMLYMLQRVKPLDTAAIQALQVPVLLLWAENDTVLSRSMVAEIEGCVPQQTTSITVQGAGHMFIELNADALAYLSLGFLQLQAIN